MCCDPSQSSKRHQAQEEAYDPVWKLLGVHVGQVDHDAEAKLKEDLVKESDCKVGHMGLLIGRFPVSSSVSKLSLPLRCSSIRYEKDKPDEKHDDDEQDSQDKVWQEAVGVATCVNQ